MTESITKYIRESTIDPLFMTGDALSILKSFPANCIDCCLTSPPYWNKRQYANGGIGLESDYHDYIDNLMNIFKEVYRVLKPSGSFWLNIGDSYYKKSLLNIPWRVSIALTEQNWILRNTVIWNKVKGGLDNTTDRLRNVYEPLFHFVKQGNYYYDIDSVRNKPRDVKIINGKVISATGVTGIQYKRKIELSSELTDEQKRDAYQALEAVLRQVREGKISDFRMIIKGGGQRTTHSDSERVSGRAKELREKGFYFLKYHPKGSKPGDLWDIVPEDTQGRVIHCAPYPSDLCRMPVILTCPTRGIVLDPFVGTGTSCLVAMECGRKSIGIDIAHEYIAVAKKRCGREPSCLSAREERA